MDKFGRVAEVVLQRLKPTETEQRFFIPLPDPVLVTELQIKFSIEKNLSGKANTCDVVITNMSPNSRAELQRDGMYVRLSAGHDRAPRFLFAGNVSDCRSVPSNTEWLTTLQLGDGALAIKDARQNRMYREGVTVLTILRDAAKSMGLTLPADIEGSTELRQQFAAGFVFAGPTRDELTRLLAPFGYNWSIQNGRLSILKDNQIEGTAIVISEATGMIDHPEPGKPTKGKPKPPLTVPVLLTPELTPGGLVELDSQTHKGRYKIIRVKHTGDTFSSDDWKSVVELQPL